MRPRRRHTALDPEVRDFLALFPPTAMPLLQASGAEFVEQMGLEVVRDIVLKVLMGENLRDSTEMLTRRRLAAINAATVVMFVRAQATVPDFSEKLYALASRGFSSSARVSRDQRWLLNWSLGLTEKAVQNVLGDDSSNIEAYQQSLSDAVSEIALRCSRDFGDISGTIKIMNSETADMSWPFLIALLGTIGAQTLTIRGSDKSVYGKLFERLILGSLLFILGYRMIEKPQDSQAPTSTDRVFWLSSQEDKRESDALLLHEAGSAVRFDMGFIGRGNSEISSDKLTRFQREAEIGGQQSYVATIIIVDRLGARSNVSDLAQRVGADIVQMSLTYWPVQIARILAGKFSGFDHELLHVADNAITEYLGTALAKVPLTHGYLDRIPSAMARPARSTMPTPSSVQSRAVPMVTGACLRPDCDRPMRHTAAPAWQRAAARW